MILRVHENVLSLNIRNKIHSSPTSPDSKNEGHL